VAAPTADSVATKIKTASPLTVARSDRRLMVEDDAAIGALMLVCTRSLKPPAAPSCGAGVSSCEGASS
jgi:hypothetical protein